MNQRLVWNFEFAAKKMALPSEAFNEHETEPLKWETRFFWPAQEIIVLNNLDKSLLDLANYQHKLREDYYYLLANQNYNVKRRRNELLYKPKLKQTQAAIGYGTKVLLDNAQEKFLQELALEVKKEGKEVLVKKQAFIYKFPTHPTIKLELARLEIAHKIYFSACVEGKSQNMVEKISERLLGQRVSCDYVSFLKNILRL